MARAKLVELTGISKRRLKLWAKENEEKCGKSVSANGNKRLLFPVDIIAKEFKLNLSDESAMSDSTSDRDESEDKSWHHVCYARIHQDTDISALGEQVNDFKRLYPNYRIVQDIGSALDMDKRPGFNELMDKARERKVKTLVVWNKDRLVRYGFEFLVRWLESTGVKVIVHSDNRCKSKSEKSTPVIPPSAQGHHLATKAEYVYDLAMMCTKLYDQEVKDHEKCQRLEREFTKKSASDSSSDSSPVISRKKRSIESSRDQEASKKKAKKQSIKPTENSEE